MKLKNVSASQLTTFKRCNRKWYWEKIEGFRSSGSVATRRGTAIHHALEHFVKNWDDWEVVEVDIESGQVVAGHEEMPEEENPKSEYVAVRRFLEAAKDYIPSPFSSDVVLEQMINMPTGEGMPPWLGFIDLLEDCGRITDYKTTSSIKSYSKSPEDLMTDIQAMSYAKYVLDISPDMKEVPLRWLYLETRNKIKVNVKESEITVSREHVESEWNKAMPLVAEMVKIAAAEAGSQSVTPNVEACNDFGGCPHKDRCGVTALSGLFEKKETGSMGFLDTLKAQTPTKEEPAKEVPAKEVPAKEIQREMHQEVLSKDAAPRTTPKTGPAEPKTPKKKAAKKKAPAKAPDKTAVEAPAKAPVDGPKTPFRLFVDCAPIKCGNFVLLEDLMGPLLDKLNADCQEHMQKPSVWLLPFGEQKAAISGMVAEMAKTLTGDVVAMSGDMHSRDVLPLLVPFASEVIRSFRG